MADEEDLRSLVIGALSLYVNKGDELKKIAKQNSKLVKQ